MFLLDVNILIYAFRADFPQHAVCRVWLENALVAGDPIALHEFTEVAFLRMVTNRRVLSEPDDFASASTFLEKLRRSPGVRTLTPRPTERARFLKLANDLKAKGNDVPDCFLAAIALDSGCTLVSADDGLKRFAGLRWLNPLTAGGATGIEQ